MIQANCRDRFTADDFQFVADILSKDSQTEKAALSDLLTDPETRDSVLDDACLFDNITQKREIRRISPFLYFYLLTRHVFLRHEIADRNIADYVASMLAQFCTTKRAHTASHMHDKRYHYLVDMMSDSLDVSSFEAFLIRSHLGNYALFVTGIFPDRIFNKSTYGRKAPGFDYYEQMGRSSFRWASQHKLAPKFSLSEILVTLSDHFRPIRIALNKISDEYIHIDHRPPALDRTLRQIMFGQGGFSADA